jgi:hypothetical protein
MAKHSASTGGFAIQTCPVCKNWTLQGSELATNEELNQIVREHLMECFGVPEELAS